MDFFGIGQAMKAIAEIYFRSARASGRTTSMLDALRDGDRVWFADPKEASRIKRECQYRQLDVECKVCDPRYPEKLFEGRPAKGRVIMDHGWIEERYRLALDQCAKDIRHFERETSHAQIEPRRDPRRKFDDEFKWRL